MDNNSILSGGVEQLNEIKDNLLELRGYQSKNERLLEEEAKLDKSIKGMEKTIADEILSTTRKRRDEIEATFDKQMDKLRARMKRIKDKRDEKKNQKVSERIAAETASLRTENSSLKLEAKTLFKQKRMPSFCNTKFYYALYAPACFSDILIIIAVLTTVLLLIPCGIYFLLIKQEKALYLILTYVITVIFFGGLYIIGNRWKEKYSQDILKVKGIRSSIRANKRKISVIKKNIKKDRDESAYGLQSFDEEMNKLLQEEEEIAQQKKEALSTFDNTTNQIIANDIQGSYEEKLSGLKEDYDKTCTESKKAEEMIKALTIKMANEYEPFVGKDLMSLERLDSLINIIQAGSAATISEAVTFYKQNMNGNTL